MKRRLHIGESPPPRLASFNPRDWIATGAESDPWAPTLGHRAWCQARAEWVAAGGVWPGGENAREMQEAILMPDEPWDGKF